MSKLVPAEDLTQENLKGITINKNFEERSDIAQEIIRRRPDFFEKWALLLFFIVLMLLLAGTWFIKYPDIIQASAVLTSHNAPKEIVPRQSGKLAALFVKTGQHVEPGEMLGWLESNADAREVMRLQQLLDSCITMPESHNPRAIAQLLSKRFTKLGELQPAYQTFIAAGQQYNDYLVNGFYLRRKNMLQHDIAAIENIRSNISAQKNINTEDNALAKQTYEMNKKLFEDKVISAEEYRKAQSALLNKQLSLPQAEVSIITQQAQIRDKQKEIDQINHDVLQQELTFGQALQTLKSSVDDWVKQYTVRAPTGGVVVFARPLQQDQFIEQGKVLGFVNPSNAEHYAELKLAQHNFGKVDAGMKVQLRFDAYPFQEVGFVPGTLNYLSNVAVDSGFIGTVKLDNGLETNQHKPIPFKNGLKGQAMIITRDMRLLERLYYSIVKTTALNK